MGELCVYLYIFVHSGTEADSLLVFYIPFVFFDYVPIQTVAMPESLEKPRELVLVGALPEAVLKGPRVGRPSESACVT